MESITALFASAALIGLLTRDKDAVPVPSSEWNDTVGQGIREAAKLAITRYNGAVRDCKDELSSLKTAAATLDVRFTSKQYDLDFYGNMIDGVNVKETEIYIQRILGE